MPNLLDLIAQVYDWGRGNAYTIKPQKPLKLRRRDRHVHKINPVTRKCAVKGCNFVASPKQVANSKRERGLKNRAQHKARSLRDGTYIGEEE